MFERVGIAADAAQYRTDSIETAHAQCRVAFHGGSDIVVAQMGGAHHG